jgi:hypothetical protein
MFNRKSAFAALVALGALAAGSSAHAGNVQWSVAVNLPVPVPVVVGAPVYHVPAPLYHQPAPVVVYRPAPPPAVVYRPVPVVDYRGWDRHHYHRHHRHHHGHRHDDHRGGYGDRDHDDRGPRWEPGPRQRHH